MPQDVEPGSPELNQPLYHKVPLLQTPCSEQPPELRDCDLNQGVQDTICRTALCWCDRHTRGTKLFHRKPEEASDGLPGPAGI